MKYATTFCPDCDRQAVVAGLAVNLGEALKSGSIPVKVGPSDVAYNGIANPVDILGRPTDEFDAIRIQSNMMEMAKSSKKKDDPAPVSGSSEPAPASSQE